MQWSSGYELRELTVSYSRTPATGVIQDAAMTTHHFLNLTGGDPDSTWTTGDYTTVEAAFDTFWGAIKIMYVSAYALAGYKWRADGPAFRPHGDAFQPTLRNTARNVVGTGAGQALPPQTAMTVTEVTPAKYTALDVEGVGTQLRNRWGRFYLPPVNIAQMDNGRYSSASTGAVATAAQNLYNTCSDADLIPVMYSPTTGSSWAVDEIRVDDLCDVIRSRRFVTPLIRNAKPINAP